MKIKYLAFLFFAALWAPAFAGSITPPGSTGDFITNGGNNQFGNLTPPIPVIDGGTGTTSLGTNGAGPIFANNNPTEHLDVVQQAIQTTNWNPLPTIGGLSRTSIGSLYNQSQLLFQTTNGLIVSPMGQGAVCNALPFSDIETVNGSNIITVPDHTFVNATQGNGGDIGKSVGVQYALAGDSVIQTVTGVHTAIVSNNAFATTAAYGVIGNDDTAGIQNSIQNNAFFTSGYIVAPPNCAIRNLTFAGTSGHGNGVTIIGGLTGSVAQAFNQGLSWDQPTWFILGSGEDNDPSFGVNIADGSSIGLRGIFIYGPAFPFNGIYAKGYGAGTVCVGGDGAFGGGGFWLGNTNGSKDFAMYDVSIENCMVGFGRSLGHTGGYIGAVVERSNFAANGVAIQGPFSDTHAIDNEISANFYAGFNFVQLGAASSGETNNILHNHIQYNGDGIVVQGPPGSSATNFNFSDNMFDAQKQCAFRFVGSWGSILIHGGHINGSAMNQASGDPFPGPVDAHICFSSNSFPGGGDSVGMDIADVQFQKRGSTGNTPYVFDSDSSFATTQTVSVHGGSLSDGFSTALTNWQVSPPPKYEQITVDTPWYRHADTGFSINASNAVGLGTANAVTGTILDMSQNTTSTNSSIALPLGTSAARPSSPITGMMRLNTTIPSLEVYYNSIWNSLTPAVAPTPTAFAISGLGLSNDLVTPNTIIAISPGSATSDDGTITLKLAGFINKTTGSWTVGSGSGCLDSGTVANGTWYYDFLIERTDTGVVDDLCSASLTSPTLPSSYTEKRYIGQFKTDSSAHILAFTQNGGDFIWSVPTLDMNSVSIGTSLTAETLNVPPGVVSIPYGSYTLSNATNAILWSSPATSPGAPTTTNPFTASPGFSGLDVNLTGGVQNTTLPYLVTNTSGQINVQATAASTTVSEITNGYHITLAQPVPFTPTFSLNFLTGTLPSGVSFTRAGTAWYFNSSGLLVSAGTNVPRFDYGTPGSSSLVGMLVEGLADTNIALWSRDLTQTSAWTATTATVALDQTGIDGVATSASSITATANNATVCQTFTTATVNSEFSVFLKRISGSGTISISNNGSTYVTESISGSWVRYFNNANVTAPQICIKLATSGDEIGVDVAQFETDPIRISLSSPIITTTASVTRAVESATVSPIPWFNTSAGTYVYNFQAANQNGLVGNFVAFNNSYATVINNGFFQIAGGSSTTLNYNTLATVGVSYTSPGGVFTTVYNGVSKGSGSALAATPSSLNIGGTLSSWAKSFQYYPYPVSTTNLQVLAP